MNIVGFQIMTRVNARDLGDLDTCLSMSTHIRNFCKSASSALKRTGNIRQYLEQPDAEKLIHAFVSSNLAYCNSFLYGLPDKEISNFNLLRTQNCILHVNGSPCLIKLKQLHPNI